MRAVVKQVAALFPTAIISGRGREKVRLKDSLSDGMLLSLRDAFVLLENMKNCSTPTASSSCRYQRIIKDDWLCGTLDSIFC